MVRYESSMNINKCVFRYLEKKNSNYLFWELYNWVYILYKN